MLKDSRDIIRRLEADGFVLVSVRGSHHKFRDAFGRIVIVTHPRRDIPVGTVLSIYRPAGPRTEVRHGETLHRADP